jgi:2-dehydro-3-deoxygluconokinase
MLIDLWKREGVDIRGVSIDADAHTGIYFVTHAAAGHEFSYLRTDSAASRMRVVDLPLDVIRAAKVLHASGISQAISEHACDAVFAAIEAARGAGAKISYDPNLRLKLWPLARARAVIVATIPLCDWFLPSLEEAQQLSGLNEPQALLDWCHARGAPIVVLKMGADGAWVSTPTMRQHVPGYRVNYVDTTGAGDCFDGAFAARLVRGDAPLMAARYANAAAALKTLGYGAVAPLPTDDAVKAFVMRPDA